MFPLGNLKYGESLILLASDFANSKIKIPNRIIRLYECPRCITFNRREWEELIPSTEHLKCANCCRISTSRILALPLYFRASARKIS